MTAAAGDKDSALPLTEQAADTGGTPAAAYPQRPATAPDQTSGSEPHTASEGMPATVCGYVAILGRPNVGKSTLLNHLLGQKLSITSRRPQTTRHQLLGVVTEGSTQLLLVDTPGLHGKAPKAINRYMNKSARSALRDVDLALFLVDRDKWTPDDELVASLIAKAGVKCLLAVNKIDRLESKAELLPLLQGLQAKMPGADLVPISALSGDNLDRLKALIKAALPPAPFYFAEDQITDRSQRFLAAEIIREKVMRQLGDELPYAATIQIERYEESAEAVRIAATVFVEKEGQKRILIGRQGARIKRIGADARRDLARALDAPVHLSTWVKIKSGWSDSARALKSLGYN